jgi:hypothetical protein
MVMSDRAAVPGVAVPARQLLYSAPFEMLRQRHLAFHFLAVPGVAVLNIIVMRHVILNSLASYIDTMNAFLSVHSAAPQLPIT